MLRSREMDVAGESLPGLVHEPATFIQKTAPILVDDNSVGIDQNHRRGLPAARVDRLDVHAVPIAGDGCTEINGHDNTIAGIEARTWRDQSDGLGGRPETGPHHREIALKSAAGENNGVGTDRRDVIAGSNKDGADAIPLPHHQAGRRGLIANRHARLSGGGRKRIDDGAAATDRLDPRRTGAEIIDRDVKRDAVTPQPSNGRCGVLCQRSKIAAVG